MPELPEVEVICRGLQPLLVGREVTDIVCANRKLRLPVARVQMGRWLRGQRILAVGRRSKYLLLRMANDAVMAVHLGMTGRLGLFPADVARAKHDHLCWRLDNGMELRFNDARRFGSVQIVGPGGDPESELFAKLGPEPLGKALTTSYLQERAAGRRQPVKNFLMDGRIVVGIGNIYASEILFAAGILPQTSVAALRPGDWRRLILKSREVLLWAIDCGGTTISDFVNASGGKGYFQLQLKVYGREGQPCQQCATPIGRSIMAGRATYFCPKCQA